VELVLGYPWAMDESGPQNRPMRRDWDADAASVARFQAGEGEAFEALVRSREREIYRTALRILDDPEDAMEATQETFIRVYRSLDSFRNDASFKTWAIGICINVCRNILASSATRMKRKTTGLTKENREDGEEMESPFPDRSPDPASVTLGSELKQALHAALKALTPEHREIIVLRDIQDMDYDEIGIILQCPGGTVKSRLARARQALREALEGIWP
jgi:RNA polymerase sigma-70 factor, ECF subfamily